MTIASRIAARSTTAGTPVKSCISTRAGRKAISRSELRVFSHSADRLDVVDRDGPAVLEAHQILEQHLHREGQARDVAEPGRLRRRLEAEIIVALAADLEGAAGLQAVMPVTDTATLLGKALFLLLAFLLCEIKAAAPHSSA